MAKREAALEVVNNILGGIRDGVKQEIPIDKILGQAHAYLKRMIEQKVTKNMKDSLQNILIAVLNDDPELGNNATASLLTELLLLGGTEGRKRPRGEVGPSKRARGFSVGAGNAGSGVPPLLALPPPSVIIEEEPSSVTIEEPKPPRRRRRGPVSDRHLRNNHYYGRKPLMRRKVENIGFHEAVQRVIRQPGKKVVYRRRNKHKPFVTVGGSAKGRGYWMRTSKNPPKIYHKSRPITDEQAQNFMNWRKIHKKGGYTRDMRSGNKKTLMKPTTAWLRYPGLYDVQGFDTPF